jgi:hypothetical protein
MTKKQSQQPPAQDEQKQPSTIEAGVVSSKDGVTAAVPQDPSAGQDPGKSDQDYQKHFPQAQAANASRESYQQTADERRVQAERAANLEQARQSKINDDPVPTGESKNPHEDEEPIEKHSDNEPPVDPEEEAK